MNSTQKIFGWGTCIGRLVLGAVGAWLLILTGGPAAAVDAYYINNAILNYPETVSAPPVIDASNFVNNSSFTINFTFFEVDTTQPFYETWDTVNYTNNGTMVANTGFQFDDQSSISGQRSPSASFYNPGLVSCGSTSDIGQTIIGVLGLLGFSECLVNATNIFNPGEVDVGEDGLIQLTGQNVNLYQGLLNIESGGAGGGIGAFGLFTNYWDPSVYLSANYAISPPFPIAPFELDLFDSTAYTNIQVAGSNVIYRAAFIEDTSGSNVTVSVFFGNQPPELGGGDVTVQWAASYLDSASGNTISTYLYLNDDYVLGVNTNIQPIFGTPINFTLSASSTPLIAGTPAARSLDINIFPAGSFSNYYDVANISPGTSVSTNSIPNASVTNLPGRVEINGAKNLDLRLAQITGPNYLSLSSTNQFHGADGALIQAPYADLYLGGTNGRGGSLAISNVIQGALPVWGGTIVAWNTRWIVPDPVITGQSNDYRVLIVSSQLSPTLLAQVQNLVLHNTNSILISDSFNVFRSFSADAQSLTLTTNPVGNGATSVDGELNLESVGILFQSSLPNLRFLTNNGAIHTPNLAYFGYPTLTNYSPSLASGTLSETGTNAVKKDKVTVGTNQYMFVATLTNTVPNQVAIVPGSFDSTLNNLIAAINGGGAGGPGSSYSAATAPNSKAMAGALVDHAFTVTALAVGTSGNSVASTFAPATASVNLSWGGHATLFGGAPTSTNLVSFLDNTALINNGIFTDQGSIIYAGNFESSGIFSSGAGNFALESLTTTLTNGSLTADGDVSITASTLVTSNLLLQASRSLTLQVTNELTDMGLTNKNLWAVGSDSLGSGFNLPIKPAIGDLLGTTVTLSAPTNRTVTSVWAGVDRGLSPAGYTDNEAIGQMVFDVAGSFTTGAGHFGELTFNGAGVSNALYIDLLVLTNFATQSGNATNNYNFSWLNIGTNMMIYFGQALANGQSVAEVIDDQSKLGANNGRLRWIYTYTGYYSSTNLYYTNKYGAVYTNTVNTALAQSSHIDSDADGIPNLTDPTPFFLPYELNFSATVTDLPPSSVRVQWTTIPLATNYVYYTTNIMATNWLPFTNFDNWYFGNNVAVTNSAHGNSFVSPQIYINNASLPDNSQQTNVWLYDSITDVPRYYRVAVWPWLNFEP